MALLRLLLASVFLGRAEGLRARREDGCACRGWKGVYETAGVACGQTNEFYLASHKSSLEDGPRREFYHHMGDEFCTHFFEAITDNFCVNINMGEDKGQWCYVDANCTELEGGAKVNHQVSWKKCSPGKDWMTRQYTPQALAKLAGEQNVNLGLFNKMAYPLSSLRWKYVSSYWGGHMDDIKTVPEQLDQVSLTDLKDYLRPRWGHRSREIDKDMTAELKAIADSNVPTTFDTGKDHHPPHVIVHNRTVWVVLPSDKPILFCALGCHS